MRSLRIQKENRGQCRRKTCRYEMRQVANKARYEGRAVRETKQYRMVPSGPRVVTVYNLQRQEASRL